MTRVLIVEDDPFLGLDLEEQLTDAGFTVVGVATSVRKGLDALSRESCDVVLLDVNLGSETSMPIAQELKACGIPFILVTGYSIEQVPKGFNGAAVLQKPLRLDLVIRTLNEHRRRGAP
jgi:DNA-binding response OmpR family regulator